MEVKIFEFETKQRQLIQKNIDVKEENRKMHEKIKSVEFTAKLAFDRTNKLEKYTRKDSIGIFGILDTKNDKTVDETIDKTLSVVTKKKKKKKKKRMNVIKSGLSIAHRLGKFSEGSSRPVIAKFKARTHKTEAITKRRKLKGTNIVITEDLAKENYLFCSRVKTHNNVEVARTRDGITRAKLRSTGRVVKVLTLRDIS